MQTRAQTIAVVVFVLSGFASLYLLAVTVSGVRAPGDQDTVTLLARFSDVANLSVDARVKLSGVTVGRVAAIRLEPEAQTALVIMNVERFALPLSKDSTARIINEGLLGSRYIALATGTSRIPLRDGELITHTESAVVLETLVAAVVEKIEYAQTDARSAPTH